MKKPVAVSRILEEYLDALGFSTITFQARLAREWPDLVGPFLAERTFPGKLKRSVLTVLVESHSLAQDLHLSKPALLGTLADRFGKEAVRDIRFMAGTLPAREGLEAPRDRVSGTPLSPEPHGLDGVNDPETRMILRSLAQKAAGRESR